ncbi:MAG: histidinol-phosphate transaminase [Ruminococcus sp.]|nr:histidinol-phosphate transaminase [Ruminococcus sp.]
MTKPWQKNLIKIEPYTAGEQPKSADIIKLNANENPYPPSPKVLQAIKDFDAGSLRLYPPMDAAPFRRAVAEFYGLEPQWVFAGNGSDDILATAFRAFFNSDEPILYPDITYSFYPVWCELLRVPYRTIPVDGEFRVHLEDYYVPNGGIVLPNPNAPTTIGLGLGEIEELLKHNTDSIVIIDEAYADFSEVSCVPLIKKYENLVVTQTLSKSRSLAGMRAAVALADPYLIKYLDAVKDSYNSYPVDAVAIRAACAAFEDREYFEETCRRVIATRERTAAALRGLGFVLPDSSTNFLFATHPDHKAEDIFLFLREKGIYIRYFKKPRIDGYLRITIGTDEQMDKLIAALSELIAVNNQEQKL